jgi:DNA primase
MTQSLIERFSDVVIWLDRDKAKNAIKMARNLKQRGINSEVVISPLDPKEYNKEEMLKWLRSK